MILLVDNYDSFVYNLARYCEELGYETTVIRNDVCPAEEAVERIVDLAPQAIVLSPGPCDPERAGFSLELVRKLGSDVPILGVCLGHQTIGAAYGAQVVRDKPLHGRSSKIYHDGLGIFWGLPNPLKAARYHSLVIAPESLPEELEIAARTEDGTVMAVRHHTHPIVGVQFHPESVLTDHGHRLLSNFFEHVTVGRGASECLSESKSA